MGGGEEGENRLFEGLLAFDELDPLLSFDHVGVLAHLVLGDTILQLAPELHALGGHACLFELLLHRQLVDVHFRRQHSPFLGPCWNVLVGVVNHAQLV